MLFRSQGNFLAATGILTASQTLGQNAIYSIDSVNGGQSLTSATNTITGIVPGVTLELKTTSTTPVTVTVSQNSQGAVNGIKAFVARINQALDAIEPEPTVSMHPDDLARLGVRAVQDRAVPPSPGASRRALHHDLGNHFRLIPLIDRLDIRHGLAGRACGAERLPTPLCVFRNHGIRERQEYDLIGEVLFEEEE